jgi:hypothetical protein
VAWAVVLASAACGTGIPDDAVATYDGGYITGAEAQRFLSWYDPRRLRTDAAVGDAAGVSQILSELAFLEILAVEAGEEPPADALLYLDQRGSLLVRYYIERTGKRSHEVTDDEAMAYYREHLHDRFTVPESVTFEHVFLRADRHSPEELDRLVSFIHDRLASGTPFNELASDFSESGSATRGGAVGPVYRGRLEPSFEEQLYRLHPDRPGVIRTPQGVHVAVVRKTRPSEVQPFESVKRQIVNAIMDERNRAERDRLLEELRALHGVEDRSEEPGLGTDEVVLRVGDRTLTLAALDAHLQSWTATPGLVGSGATDRRRLAVSELITANLLYLDAVARGLDREQEFLDRWAVRELRRRSNVGLRQRLDAHARKVPEEELLRYYRDNEGRFAVPQRFRGSFLVMPFGSAPPFELQQRLERLAELAASPDADPDEIAQRCADAGATYAGMDWITPLQAARVGPEFQRRLLELDGPGSTGVFKDEGGLYAVIVHEIEARRPMAPGDDLDLIRARYVDLRRDEIVRQMQQQLLDERHFEVLSTDVFSTADAS